MAILTLVAIENFFQNITCQMLGIDTSLQQNQSKVRISWPSDGAPAWKITDDVVFIQVNNISDPITKQRNTGYSALDSNNVNRITSYTRVHSINWTIYGPNSFDNAEAIRTGLYNFFGSFATKNLFLNVDVDTPVRSPELFGGQWWDRSNLMANFNELVVLQSPVPYIQTPNVITKADITTAIDK